MAEGRPDFNGSNYDDAFLGDLVNFVASNSFQSMFENYFLSHALFFSDDEEHKLEYMDYYQEFHKLFEEQLEGFCQEKNMTQSEFMQRCNEASTEDPKAKHYITILLSSVEYDTFVKLMKIMRPVAERRKAMEEAMAAASLDDVGSDAPAGDDAKADAKGSADDDALAASKDGGDADDGADDKGAAAKEDPLEGSMDSKGEPVDDADAKGAPERDADGDKGAGDKVAADEK